MCVFKRRINIILSLLLSVILLFLFAGGGVFVKAEEIDEVTDEENELLTEFIAEVQGELSESDTTVEYVLQDFIERMNDSTDLELNEMGEAAEQMLQDYNEEFNNNQVQQRWIFIGNRFMRNRLLRAAVAAALGYFLFKGYSLSAELLMRARTNTCTSRVYIPRASNVVTRTAIFQDIGANDYWDSETSAQFVGGSTIDENDAHFAINWFSFTTERCGDDTLIHITDTYDFDFDDCYSGIVGLAVGTMAIAQRVGVIVTYQVNINKWYYGA